MLQEADAQRIERLKRRLSIDHKVDVVRAGLDLLEQAADRKERAARWRRAAALVAAGSRKINAEFRAHSRLTRDES